MKIVEVVAAAIMSPCGNQVFLAKRDSKAHQGGLWEFPGGKVEAKESVTQALAREIFEELNSSDYKSNLNIYEIYISRCKYFIKTPFIFIYSRRT